MMRNVLRPYWYAAHHRTRVVTILSPSHSETKLNTLQLYNHHYVYGLGCECSFGCGGASLVPPALRPVDATALASDRKFSASQLEEIDPLFGMGVGVPALRITHQKWGCLVSLREPSIVTTDAVNNGAEYPLLISLSNGYCAFFDSTTGE